MDLSTMLKEYKKLRIERRKVDTLLRAFVIKKLPRIPYENDLLEIAKLHLKGGPRDLSSRLDFYLYQR